MTCRTSSGRNERKKLIRLGSSQDRLNHGEHRLKAEDTAAVSASRFTLLCLSVMRSVVAKSRDNAALTFDASFLFKSAMLSHLPILCLLPVQWATGEEAQVEFVGATGVPGTAGPLL